MGRGDDPSRFLRKGNTYHDLGFYTSKELTKRIEKCDDIPTLQELMNYASKESMKLMMCNMGGRFGHLSRHELDDVFVECQDKIDSLVEQHEAKLFENDPRFTPPSIDGKKQHDQKNESTEGRQLFKRNRRQSRRKQGDIDD